MSETITVTLDRATPEQLREALNKASADAECCRRSGIEPHVWERREKAISTELARRVGHQG